MSRWPENGNGTIAWRDKIIIFPVSIYLKKKYQGHYGLLYNEKKIINKIFLAVIVRIEKRKDANKM